MSNAEFSSTFLYKTVKINERKKFFLDKRINISDYNTTSYPFKQLKQMDIEGHKINDEEKLLNLYHFKQTYFALVLKYILQVEKSLKENVSYVVGTKHGDHTYIHDKEVNLANDYLNPNNYSVNKDKKVVEKVLTDLKQKVVKPPSYCESIKKYRGRTNLPPYILAKDLMLSSIIDWYYVLNNDDTIDVMSMMLQRDLRLVKQENVLAIKQFFLRALRLLKETRNNYAHSNHSGEYTADNYKGITFDSISLLFDAELFSTSISKNTYDNFVKNSAQSVSNICLLVLLDGHSKVLFIQEMFTLFEVDCNAKYNIDSEMMRDELKLNEFFKLVENVYYDFLSVEKIY